MDVQNSLFDLFRMERATLTALILTSYTQFDLGMVGKCIQSTRYELDGIGKNIWLYQCNPSRDQESKQRGWLVRKPNCMWNASRLKCADCLLDSGGNRRKSPLKCFHPKVWLLRFKRDDRAIVWRLVVSSKNFSRGSWNLMDCYFTMDGNLETPSNETNQPELFAFLAALHPAPLPDLWQELGHVAWEQGYGDVHFWFQNGGRAKPFPWEDAQELHMLSPFVSDSFRPLVAPGTICHLYSQREQIQALTPANWADTFHFHTMLDQGPTKPVSRNAAELEETHPFFHAKCYLWKNKKEEWHLALGSPNTSMKAFQANTEAAVWFSVDSEAAEEILREWEAAFDGTTSPIGQGTVAEDEAPAQQFDKPYDDADVAEFTQHELAQFDQRQQAEMFRAGQRTLLSIFGTPLPSSFWDGCVRANQVPDQGQLEKLCLEAEQSYPMLSQLSMWQTYRQDCLNVLISINEQRE